MIPTNANFDNANAALAKQPIYLFSISGYARVFTNYPTAVGGQYPWIKKLEPMGWRVQDLEGNSTLSDLTITVNDQAGGITADFPGFVFEGKQATLKTGFPGMSQADFVTVATMVVGGVNSCDDNTAYEFCCQDEVNRKLKKVIYRTGDNGFWTSEKNPKSVSGNPMDILVDVLQNEVGLLSDIFSLNFDGTDDYVKLGELDNWGITNQITLSAWAKISIGTPPNNQRMIITLLAGSHLSIDSDGIGHPYLRLSIDGTERSLDSLFTPEIDTWYHVAGTYDGDKLRIYVDGVLKNTSPSYPGNLTTLTPTTRFIGKHTSSGYRWSGLLDEVRVYNRALSDSEVAMLAVGGEPSVSGLVGYWRFEEGTGTSTADSSGKGNAGTLVGIPTWEYDVPDKLNQINFAAIANLKNTLFAGSKMRFQLTTAPEAKQFIDLEISKALGGYSFQNSQGKFTPFFWTPTAAPVSALTLTEKNVVGIPESWESELINAVTYRLDYDGKNFLTELVDLYGPSIDTYGLQGFHIIESRGLALIDQNWNWARLMSNGLFLRYGSCNLGVRLTAFWTAVIVEPGDYVRVTHSKIPHRAAGALGITNRLFGVVEVRRDFEAGTVELTLLDAAWLDDLKGYQVAPDSQTPWTEATQQEKDTYQFVCDFATGKYSDNTPGHKIF